MNQPRLQMLMEDREEPDSDDEEDCDDNDESQDQEGHEDIELLIEAQQGTPVARPQNRRQQPIRGHQVE
jgi:hypothetical protein